MPPKVKDDESEWMELWSRFYAAKREIAEINELLVECKMRLRSQGITARRPTEREVL